MAPRSGQKERGDAGGGTVAVVAAAVVKVAVAVLLVAAVVVVAVAVLLRATTNFPGGLLPPGPPASDGTCQFSRGVAAPPASPLISNGCPIPGPLAKH